MRLREILEAVLFVRGEPTSAEELQKITGENAEDISRALDELERDLTGRGIRLIRTDHAVMLATAPDASLFVQKVAERELGGTLTKAMLETVAIIVYRGPISRPDIDYIRGVNSSFTLRNLMVRGIVERAPHPKDRRTFVYRPSVELLQFLGVVKLEEIPEYALFRQHMDTFFEQERTEGTP